MPTVVNSIRSKTINRTGPIQDPLCFEDLLVHTGYDYRVRIDSITMGMFQTPEYGRYHYQLHHI